MPSVSDIQAYVQLTRPQNASGSVLTYSIGYFLATGALHLDFFIGLIILLALHSLATVQNDIEDFEIDKANKRKSALQNQSLSLSNARVFVQALLFFALTLALLSAHSRLHLIAIVGLILVSWLYNLNPIRASRRPIVSILTMGICYGALPFMYGYLVAGGSLNSRYFIILAVVWFLARISTAIMKDYKDAAGDKLFNKNTFYLRYGGKVTAWTSITLAFIAYIGMLVILVKLKNISTAFILTLVLTGLLALRSIILRFKLTKTKSEKQLNMIFHKSVFSHNQLEAAVLICLILS